MRTERYAAMALYTTHLMAGVVLLLLWLVYRRQRCGWLGAPRCHV